MFRTNVKKKERQEIIMICHELMSFHVADMYKRSKTCNVIIIFVVMYISCEEEQEQKHDGNDASNKDSIQMSWKIKTQLLALILVFTKHLH